MTASEFSGPGLTVEQWSHIQALATSLSPKQQLWLSGYFAGLDHASRAGAEVTVVDAPAQPPLRTLTILYGSETGTCAALAQSLGEQAREQGLSPAVTDMGDYKLRHLRDEQDLLIIASTHGEGDPPQSAATFFEFIESRKAPALSHVRFSVLALGDSTYERYCEAGRRLDRRLEGLGAVRLQPRAECDVDYEEPAAAWADAVLSHLAPAPRVGTSAAAVMANAPVSQPPATPFDRRRPFAASVVENLVLTGRGSSKETRHVELSLEGSGLLFEPGDSLGVAPRNDPLLVEAILESVGLRAEAAVTTKAGATSLGEGLETAFEITAATPRLIEHWADLSGAAVLRDLARQDNVAARMALLRRNHVIDVLRAYPVRGLEPQALLAGLRPLQPRLYSIASSLAASPDEVHLTVSTVRYDLNDSVRWGVVSGQLAERAPLDSLLPVYIQPNPHFRLPSDDTPILMIGAGTGVAPYRAFLQEREVRGAGGRSWLVFGERNFRTDFLYQTEWQELLRDGVLTRMDVAFSRDEARKVYVQDRLREHAAQVYGWLEEGAHLYVCGDAAKLAPDVHEALIDIVAAQGAHDREAAEDYLRTLQRDRRYQLDVY